MGPLRNDLQRHLRLQLRIIDQAGRQGGRSGRESAPKGLERDIELIIQPFSGIEKAVAGIGGKLKVLLPGVHHFSFGIADDGFTALGGGKVKESAGISAVGDGEL